MNEDESKPKAELNLNLTNLVENVETGAGLDVLKNVIEDEMIIIYFSAKVKRSQAEAWAEVFYIIPM